MKSEVIESDITVIGGGLAGVCAAIGAARQGARAALVQNRPVLGGNSSSEVRVWVCGATAHGAQHFARETGIMGELFLENQYQNPEGNPYYWDIVVLDAVRHEPNIELFLDTDIRTVDADGPEESRVVRSVSGWMMGSERLLRFVSDQFVDCSGDGFVGMMAGARFRTGCESRDTYGEPWAPDTSNPSMLGSTILFYSKDVGHRVKYVAPSFARDISATTIPSHRIITEKMQGCSYWWIEWGGEHDIVHDNDEIRHELQAVVYGIWDYIKNSGKFEADNLTLEWVGSVPGKREYRRLIGDYTITQGDILDQTEFSDRVAFGGWSIDLHPPGGVYSTEPGSRHWYSDGVYHIPLRSLYSQNVRNLWMAGRNISCSHVAFGSTRVMGTCAVVGEAAGVAAALAEQRGVTARDLATTQMDQVHRALVRSDASVLGVRNTDPADLALSASVRSSSTLRELAVEASAGTLPLDSHVGMVLPVDPAMAGLGLLVDAADATELVVELYSTGRPQNYLPAMCEKIITVSVPEGPRQWVPVPLDWSPGSSQNAFVVMRANPAVALHHSESTRPGTLFFRHREPPADELYPEQWRYWKQILHRRSICYRLDQPTEAFAASHVRGGYARPYGGPQMWVSDSLEVDDQPWVELSWKDPVSFREVALIFDDNVEEDLINLHHHRTPFDVMPGLVRDYRVEAAKDGAWSVLACVRANRWRHRVHRMADTVTASRLRVVVMSTNGARQAHVVAVRAYADSVEPSPADA